MPDTLGQCLRTGESISLGSGQPDVLFFFQTDCPTCQLAFEPITRLAKHLRKTDCRIHLISQDSKPRTLDFIGDLNPDIPIIVDDQLRISNIFNPQAVPTLMLLDSDSVPEDIIIGFDKSEYNRIATRLATAANVDRFTLLSDNDGLPASKPGCGSRHLEPEVTDDGEQPVRIYGGKGNRASRIDLPTDVDPYDYCEQAGLGDGLPVIPPTLERVEKFLNATTHAPDEVIGRIAPNYGEATIEKIAANAVMAGCKPEMMPVLITLVKALCDERANTHGFQATTHFAAPLFIINGPIREQLGFASGSNVFSNVARANSTLGRAAQLLLLNLGGARPGEIDMSTLGNPGKFSFCIAENEETSPWEPFHVARGFNPDDSALTLFACEPPTGVSEHNARDGKQILWAIAQSLKNVWSPRACLMVEALVVICPEHADTLKREGWSRADVKEYLFDHSSIPASLFENSDGAEGVRFAGMMQTVRVGEQPCYRKFLAPDNIHVLVAGGHAGKFSAVLGGWVGGQIGSQMVTLSIVDPSPIH